MYKFNRRTFLKLLGQGTAALGMGMGVSGRAWARTGGATKAASVTKSTKGKYQIFQPGVYLDWEKEIIEEKWALAKKGPQKREVSEDASKAVIAETDVAMAGRMVVADVVTEEDILTYNRRWDPYNPLFNDKEYARKAGYPGIPAWPIFKSARGGGVGMIPKDIADKYHEKDLELFRKRGKQVYEWKVQTKAGEIRDVVFNKATTIGPDGKISGLIGVISDVTERKRAEEELRESESRLRALLDSSIDVILISKIAQCERI